MTKIGEKIKEKRIAKGLSQQALADAIGVTSQYISQVEKGKSSISDESIFKLEQFFNESITEQNKCANIPFLVASAGGGYYVDSETTYPMSTNEILQLGVNINDLLMIKIKGTSMTPTINDGDTLIISKIFEPVENGSIFIVSYEDKIFCKRILTGLKYIILKSDNPEYPPEKIEGDEIGKFKIIGKVIFRMNKFK
ncbi:MAG: XRE family transcriptional regulator [Candidatus Gastranaerophilales bacterium]|nr:XRE family transcriptional regulator [Candidatus Gastranaerophilales bacterium]